MKWLSPHKIDGGRQEPSLFQPLQYKSERAFPSIPLCHAAHRCLAGGSVTPARRALTYPSRAQLLRQQPLNARPLIGFIYLRAVGPDPAIHHVDHSIARQNPVISRLSQQRIRAAAAVQLVFSSAAKERVIAAVAPERIGHARADQPIVPLAA